MKSAGDNEGKSDRFVEILRDIARKMNEGEVKKTVAMLMTLTIASYM